MNSKNPWNNIWENELKCPQQSTSTKTAPTPHRALQKPTLVNCNQLKNVKPNAKRVAKKVKPENCVTKVTKSELHDMCKELRPNDLRSRFVQSEVSPPQAQIKNWLNVLDREDDFPSCCICLELFWHKSSLVQHLISAHQIKNPSEFIAKEKKKRAIALKKHKRQSVSQQSRSKSMSHETDKKSFHQKIRSLCNQ